MPLIPPDTDMSHYPPDVLQMYLEAVKNDKAAGYESDEAVLSDDGLSDIESDTDDKPVQPHNTTTEVVAAKLQKMHIGNDIIQSDDSGFSSEDEFIDDGLRHELNIRRELILGRPPTELEEWKLEKLVDYHLAYVKQLNDADKELEELFSQGESASGVLVSGERRGTRSSNSGDAEVEVTEPERQSRAKLQETERDQLVRGLVVLAQTLFRKEKQIKQIVAVQGIQLTAPR